MTQEAVSIQDQLLRVKDAWDPQSPACEFIYYFYNRVPTDQVHLYQMPPGANQLKWDKAVAERPDSSSVPVLAVGFDDLRKRQELQTQQCNAYRVRMHEISEKLKQLDSAHELKTTVKLAEMRARHASLAARTLRLAVRLQVEASKGRGLSPEEELYVRRLKELLDKADDPSVFGSISECWARVQSVGARAKPAPVLDWDRDASQLNKVAQVLASQQTGIKFLCELLDQDMALAEKHSN